MTAIIWTQIPVLERTAMRLAYRVLCVVVMGSAIAGKGHGQPPAAAATEETGRSIAGGGISVAGWEGKVDDGAAKAGQTVKDAMLAPDSAVAKKRRGLSADEAIHVTTGPAVTYWNPKNVAKGDYTV